MKRKILVVVLVFGIISGLSGQDWNYGSLEIVKDTRIDTLCAMHKEINSVLSENINDDGIEGYRIQIFFDSGNNSKARANDVIAAFIERYPEVSAYISFKEPYYRVRVGDFRTKLQALGFLHKIIGVYPNAWIIKSKISFPDLETNRTYSEMN
jgi:hypothetical protein